MTAKRLVIQFLSFKSQCCPIVVLHDQHSRKAQAMVNNMVGSRRSMVLANNNLIDLLSFQCC